MSTAEAPKVPVTPKRIELIGLDEIIIDREIQQRIDWKEDGAPIVEYAELMKEGTKFPASVVYEGEDGATFLADGFTRYYAARMAGKTKLACEIRTGTKEDAIWFACSANKAHGFRRTNSDKMNAVITAIKHPKSKALSDRAIAEHCGVSNTMVSLARGKMEEAGVVAERTETKTASGKTIKNTKELKEKRSAAGKAGAAKKAETAPPKKPGKKSPATKGDVSAVDTQEHVASPTATVLDGKVLDADGTEVTGDTAKAFSRVGWFQQMSQALRVVAQRYDTLVKEGTGCFLGAYDATVLVSLAEVIDAATPFKVNDTYTNGWEPKDISKCERNKDFKDGVTPAQEEI